jgi:CheY-like chemotaxis protein
MSRQLKRLAYQVTTETDSTKALEMLEEGELKIDILITDQPMPGITGADLVKKLKEKRPELPVIMMTGHSDMVSEEEATATGVDRFLRKVVSKDVIRRVVRELLQQGGACRYGFKAKKVISPQ